MEREMIMIERVAAAIEGVNLFSRFNDWTSDRVEGFPIEICQRSTSGVVEDNVIVARFAGREQDCSRRLDEVRRVWRAKAAINAMLDPAQEMIKAGATYDGTSGHDGHIGKGDAALIWRAMLDAALKEATNG